MPRKRKLRIVYYDASQDCKNRQRVNNKPPAKPVYEPEPKRQACY